MVRKGIFMVRKGKVLVCDVDGTIAYTKRDSQQDYSELKPIQTVLDKLKILKSEGWHIIISTSRNMRTYDGDIDAITENMLPILIKWLDKHKVPYDEIHIGRPWCGYEGFYVDDKTVRPREFVDLSNSEIRELLERDKIDS
jgi:capsule biosynthesis phosphatase